MQATHRSARTVKGWDKSKPKLRGERARVYARCHCAAFLDCARLKYPITGKSSGCAPDCRGLRAALSRAAQQHHPQLVAKARRIGRAARCRWAV